MISAKRAANDDIVAAFGVSGGCENRRYDERRRGAEQQPQHKMDAKSPHELTPGRDE